MQTYRKPGKVAANVAMGMSCLVLLLSCTQAPPQYSPSQIVEIARSRGFVVRELPDGAGPFSFEHQIWFTKGDTIRGSYESKKQKVKFQYPTDPENDTIVWILKKPDGERCHLLAIVAEDAKAK